MTRIVYTTHSGADSGAEQSSVSLIASWPNPEARPLLVLGDHGPIEARARRSGVEVLTVALDPSIVDTKRHERRVGRMIKAATGLLRHASQLQRVLEDRHTDVVVATSLKSLVFGRLAGRRVRATIVWGVHDRISADYFPWFLVPLMRYVAPWLVDGIIVNSHATRETIRPGHTPVLVATPPVELDPRSFNPPGDTVRRVVVLGRLSPWKGQDLFLRAFAEVFGDAATKAYIVGGALFGESEYQQELVLEAQRLGIADRVQFVGHVDDPWAWLVDADVLVHCSRIPEPFGRVVVQGLWARCAVVATRPGGPEEIITPGVDGLLVECGSEEGMISALRVLRDDPATRRALADQGHETARQFEASVVAPRVHRFLEDVHRKRLRMPAAHPVDGLPYPTDDPHEEHA